MPTDPKTRPSRRGWPIRTQPATTPAGTHDHGLPPWLKPALIGCAVAIVALAVAVAYLLVYILGRGEVRDQQNRDTREQVRQSLCDVLDGLPQGGVLDLTRDKLGCGPGMPLESYPPEIRQQLTPPAQRPATEPIPSAAPTTAPEPPPAAAPPPAQSPTAEAPVEPPAGADGPPATAAPPPLSPPSQVRQLVCDLLPVCTEGAP